MVRVDAASSDATLKTLAFSRNGQVTLVLINNIGPTLAQSVTAVGLPAGQYGACQTVGGAICTELGVRSVAGGRALLINVPANAVLTLYPVPGQQPAADDHHLAGHAPVRGCPRQQHHAFGHRRRSGTRPTELCLVDQEPACRGHGCSG